MPQPNKHNPEWTDDELKLIAVSVKGMADLLRREGRLSRGETNKVLQVASSIQHKCQIFAPEHNPEIVLPPGFTLG